MQNKIFEYYNTQIQRCRDTVTAENLTAVHFGISLYELKKIIG